MFTVRFLERKKKRSLSFLVLHTVMKELCAMNFCIRLALIMNTPVLTVILTLEFFCLGFEKVSFVNTGYFYQRNAIFIVARLMVTRINMYKHIFCFIPI